MMKPSPDLFEASSDQSCKERTEAFSHHSDARPAREMCANISVACLRMMADQLFQAAWFQLLQVTSLAAVTTGRTEVKILVSFWPEHSLRSDLRAPNLKHFLEEHAPIYRWPYRTKMCVCVGRGGGEGRTFLHP